MDFRQETLLNPPFAKDPPVKLNIPAKTLGLVYAILAAIAAIFGIFGILFLLGLSGFAAAAGLAGLTILPLVGSIVGEIGTIVVAWGGYQMYQEKREGKKLAIYGIVVYVLGSLISALGGGPEGFVGWIVTVLIAFVLYYLVIISRFSGEPLLVPAGTTPPAPRPESQPPRDGPPAP
ncbi:MAG: hypothetical protein ACRDF0_01215 [Candidatus Limnocylindria bacterium]